MGDDDQLHSAAVFLLRKSSGTHRTEGFLGPRTSLNGYGEKNRNFPTGFRTPQSFEFVASRHTEYAIFPPP